MMGQTHRDGAVLSALCISPYILASNKLNIQAPCIVTVLIMAGAIVGGYAPDIDEPRSRGGRACFMVMWPFYLFRWILHVLSYLPGPMNRIFRKIDKSLQHRGIFHSLIMWIVLYTIILWLIRVHNSTLQYKFISYGVNILEVIKCFLIGIVIGVMSHLFLDLLSDGVMLFSPLSSKRFSLARIKTNSFLEIVIHIIIVIANLKIIYSYLWSINL